MNVILKQAMRLRCWAKLFGWVLAGSLAAPLQAQTLASEPELLRQARHWVSQSVAKTQAQSGAPWRMEFTLGALDSRLRLASCARVEPYLAPGTRLWGKTRLGLRCLDGVSRWNVFLPLTVKALGPAWVLRRDVAPGAPLGAADLMQAEVDWAEDLSPVLADASQWQGQAAARALTTGQVLRQNMVRAQQVFQAGAQVRVLAHGPGFQISSDAQALSAGVVGELARVRMDNGRVLSGTVLDARTVRLAI